MKMWMLLIVSLGLGTVGVRAGELTNDGWECGGDLWDDRFICDGFVQCDDDSDEGAAPGEGCNLFPESGCPSPGARRRFRCARTGECFDQRGQAEQCETSTGPPARDCEVQTISGETVAGNQNIMIQLPPKCINIIFVSRLEVQAGPLYRARARV